MVAYQAELPSSLSITWQGVSESYGETAAPAAMSEFAREVAVFASWKRGGDCFFQTVERKLQE
jgi:hypothetical protein